MKLQTVFVLCLCTLMFAGGSTSGPEITTPQSGASQPVVIEEAPADQGLRAYIDPATREFVEPEFVDTRAAMVTDPENMSTEGLVEKKNSIAGGGVGVSLQGRFRNTSTVVINADGTVSAPCVSARPEQVDEHIAEQADAETANGGDDR
jgi:hypothetical protein